jgi:amyloid beta precursor protein binding protein 1
MIKYIELIQLPSNVRQLFNHESVKQPKDFWVLVSALEKFVELKGVLPLPGKVPDMKANTISYISLQKM